MVVVATIPTEPAVGVVAGTVDAGVADALAKGIQIHALPVVPRTSTSTCLRIGATTVVGGRWVVGGLPGTELARPTS